MTSRTASTKNAFGEQQFTDTTASDDVVLQFVDNLEDPAAGNVRSRALIAVTDPRNLTPTVTDRALVDGVTYRILEVRAAHWKGIHILDKVILQETG